MLGPIHVNPLVWYRSTAKQFKPARKFPIAARRAPVFLLLRSAC